jgi:phage terminase large subunit
MIGITKMELTNRISRISDIVAVPHLKTFNNEQPHQLIHGGRRGFKSTKHATKIVKRVLEDKYCEVIIVREDYTDHRFSTFPAMKRAFSRLGIKLIPNIHCSTDRSTSLWIKLPT